MNLAAFRGMMERAGMRDQSKTQISRGGQSQPLRVGFYGCSDQLVRVGWVRPGSFSRAPTSATVDCPACGNQHTVKNFMFRAAKSKDEWDTCEVHVTSEHSCR